MKTFQKIDGPYKRDPDDPKVISSQWRNPAVAMLADVPIWVASEKIDGTNIRIGWDGYDLTAGGRTDKAQIPAPLMEHLENTFFTEGIEEWFEEHFPVKGDEPHDVVLFGEGFGPKIQNGGKYREDVSFIGFDVYVNGIYLSPKNSESIFDSLNIEFVGQWDTLDTGWNSGNVEPTTLTRLIGDVRSGVRSEWNNFNAEGLVARTVEPLYDQRGERLIVKIKPDNLPTRDEG